MTKKSRIIALGAGLGIVALTFWMLPSNVSNTTLQSNVITTNPGLIASYSFDNNHNDSSQNGYNGTVSGATYDTVNKKLGSHAIMFDGINDYSTGVPGANINTLLDNKISISSWVRKSADQSGWSIVAQRTKSGGYGEYFVLGFSNNAISFLVNPSGGSSSGDAAIITGPVLQKDRWYHIVGTYDGTNIKLYVDNVLIDTKAKTGSFADDNQPFLFGAGRNDATNTYEEFYKGLLDEVEIYNYALSTAEINTLYNEENTTTTIPGSPILTQATPGNNQVTLGWSAPVSDGGSPITEYIIEYKKSNEVVCSVFSGTISVSNRTATITGLINGTEYKFRVYAKNSIGESILASNEMIATPMDTVANYTVTATAGANGTISPGTRSVNHGGTTTFTVTPSAGYTAAVTGCGGTLSGNTYTTGVITSACTVSATFRDTTAPNAPSRPVGVQQTEVIISPDGATITVSTSVVSLGLKVNCTAGETIKIYNGVTVSPITSQTCISNPQTVNLNPSSLAGILSISATLTDTAGNESLRSSTVTILQETGTIIAPGTPDMTDETDSGVSNTDNFTNNPRPQFRISCTEGNTVYLYEDNTVLGTGKIELGTGPCLTNTALITPLQDIAEAGIHLLSAQQKNPSTGTISGPSNKLSVYIDTTAPTVPTNIISSNISQTGVTISWTASTDTAGIGNYSVYRDNIKVYTTVGSGTSFTDSGLSLNTTYTYTVRASDITGNLSNASSSFTITTLKQTTTGGSSGGGGGGGGGGSLKINGTCSTTLKTFATTNPDKNSLSGEKLCKTGTPTTVTYDSSNLVWTYTCRGNGGGTTDTCTVSAGLNAAPSNLSCETKTIKKLPFGSCKLNDSSFINFHRYLSCLGVATAKNTCTEAGCGEKATRQDLTAMAVRIREIPLESGYKCQKKHTDTVNGTSAWVCEVVEKAQTAGLISATNKQFRPLDGLTRSEAYSILLKSICIHPNTTSQNWQTEVAKTALKYGFTTRSVSAFEPNKSILRQELFVLAARIAEWKAKNPNSCGELPEALLCK